jgi:ribonuclease Z
MRWEAIEELEIFGGRSALDRVHDLLFGVVLRGQEPPISIKLQEVKPGLFLDAEDFTLSAFSVSHRGPDCLGFLFEERSHRPFLADEAEALGIPSGPERRDLVNGKTITLKDGRQVSPDQVMGPLQRGIRLVVVGDAGRTDDLLDVCQDADALVIESTYLEAEAGMARQFSHLTARQAAELAQRSGVRKLFLTHISRRYREKDVLEEALAIFPDTVVVRDFDVFQVKREA